MGVKLIKENVKDIWKNVIRKIQLYRYPLLVLVAGVGLLLLPGKKEPVKDTATLQHDPESELEARMEALIAQIDGAGSVRVLLTLESGVEKIYLEDYEQKTREDETERRSTTVLVSENGNDVPVVIKTKQPIYKGAVVVCSGADRAAVRLNIVRAVSSLTGLGSDKITVVKMKG